MEGAYKMNPHNAMLLLFKSELSDLLENRIYSFFRRLQRFVLIVIENPYSLRLMVEQTSQVRDEINFYFQIVSTVLAPLVEKTYENHAEIAGDIIGAFLKFENITKETYQWILADYFHVARFEINLYTVGCSLTGTPLTETKLNFEFLTHWRQTIFEQRLKLILVRGVPVRETPL